MKQAVQAIYENGVLRPLQKLSLGEHQQVNLIIETVETVRKTEDPLDGIRCATGIPDLAEHFDDYRLGRKTP